MTAALAPIVFVAFSAIALVVQPASAGEAVTDALGRTVEIGSTHRIVTLGPDVSEIAFALGAGSSIVALDRSSRYPPAALDKPNLGYRRALSPEAVLALRPDLILAAEDIGPAAAVDVLKAASVDVVFTPEDNSLAGIRRKIDLIASALGREQQGSALSMSVSADFQAAAGLANRIPEHARRRVMFFHGLARLTAAGRDTAADAIIGLAGGVNPFRGVRGYKAVAEEVLIDMAPDTILMMSDGKGGPTPDEVFSIPALRTSPAARTGSLIVLDGPYMLGFGPRTADAIRKLAFALYPDVEARGE